MKKLLKEMEDEEYNQSMTKLMNKYLLDLNDVPTLKLILSKIDLNNNNLIEKSELLNLLSIVGNDNFKLGLSNLQKSNLEFLVKKVNENVEKLDKKYFFKYYTPSNFIESLKQKEKKEKKKIVHLSSGNHFFF
jgi:hypothetical protein